MLHFPFLINSLPNVVVFLVFGDPHVAIPIPGSDYPLCYDITGYDGDVIELLSVKDSGTILYLFYFPKKAIAHSTLSCLMAVIPLLDTKI